MAYFSSVTLTAFRCYDSAQLRDLNPGFVVLTGPNGAGKTNVLEAVSLLSPGRGLRGAPLAEMCLRESTTPCAVSAHLETSNGTTQLGTGADPETGKRIVRIDGKTTSKAALGEHLSCLWLTPQMDGLFLEGAGARRRFLNRLVYAFDPAHAGRVTRYENAMRQRSKLLQDGKNDDSWLSGLEQQMAETGMAIAAARLTLAQHLQTTLDQAVQAPFPAAMLALEGTLENALNHQKALEIEQNFYAQLQQTRGADALTGGAAVGPHKSDLSVHYKDKDMPAAQCSTGEQKALLIGLILAHAHLIKAERGAPPILLLDEVAAHLDESRRQNLYDLLGDLGGQVWLTGTDKHLFDHITAKGQFFAVSHGEIS